MRVLITNDDGYFAVGIKTIANAFCKAGHEVIVVAPYTNRSANSHSLTIRKEMKFYHGVENVVEGSVDTITNDGYEKDVKLYALDGSPADTIKFALYFMRTGDGSILPMGEPDVVVSGINDGPNLGMDIMYSGTVGASIEGVLHGLPAIAVSVSNYGTPEHFDTTARVAVENVQHLMSVSKNVAWNINCPDVLYNELKGIKYTTIGHIEYDDYYTKTSTDNSNGYTLGGVPTAVQSSDIANDVGAVNAGYVSISPIKINRTEYEQVEAMQCK